MKSTEIKNFTDKNKLNSAAAEFIMETANKAVETRGVFTFALSGGNTPLGVYELLASSRFNQPFPWFATHIFWGDERCVPYDDRRSNFKAAFDALISKVPVPEKNIHKIPSITHPETAAEKYEKILKTFFNNKKNTFPQFDLILLGVGNDGHTASLFPKSKSLDEKTRWIIATDIPETEPRVKRISFTLPVINNSANVLFMATGKEDIIEKIHNCNGIDTSLFPAAMVRPAGELLWFVSPKSGD